MLISLDFARARGNDRSERGLRYICCSTDGRTGPSVSRCAVLCCAVQVSYAMGRCLRWVEIYEMHT
eukprot:4299284-Pleurochrysis_carterae.AAC.2